MALRVVFNLLLARLAILRQHLVVLFHQVNVGFYILQVCRLLTHYRALFLVGLRVPCYLHRDIIEKAVGALDLLS